MSSHLSALLPYFISVAETGSLTAASRAQSITQPALSRKIHQLEAALGTTLFRRHARGMTVTSAGEVLLRRGRLMQIETQRAIEEIQLLKGEGKGRVTVSAGPYWCLTILPEVIAKVTEAYPGFTFDVHLAGAKPDVDAVASGKTDLYAGGIDVTYCRGLGLEVVQAAALSYIIFAPPRHPLAGVTNVEIADLAAHPWVRYRSDGAWPFIVDTIQRHADAPVNAQVSSDSLIATLEQAARGPYLMGMSRPLAGLAARFGLQPLASQPLDFQFPTGFCYGASAKDLPPLALLIEKLEAAVAR